MERMTNGQGIQEKLDRESDIHRGDEYEFSRYHRPNLKD